MLLGGPGRFVFVPGSRPDDVAGSWQVVAEGPPGCLRVVAYLTDPDVTRTILDHLRLPSTPPPRGLLRSRGHPPPAPTATPVPLPLPLFP